jgi:hypothetical protein
MSKEKHERHDASHDDDRDHAHKRGGDGGAADHASEAQRKAPDAGVRAHGGRWGDDEEMFDIKGRILSVSVHGDHSEVLIAAGREQGVHRGMEGYLMAGDTFLSEIDVIGVDKRVCRARVEATPDQIGEHLDDIVINPSSKPAKAATAAKDFKTRVISVSIIGGRSQITVAGGRAQGVEAGGRAQGVEAGMHGVLLDAAGKKIISFTLDEVAARFGKAFVDTTLDEIHTSHSAIVNPG